MGTAKMPRSLRAVSEVRVGEGADPHSGRKVTAVAGLIAVASFSGAEAQQSTLPPVTVDAPGCPAPAGGIEAKSGPDLARTALRRAARRAQPVPVAPVPFPNAGGLGR